VSLKPFRITYDTNHPWMVYEYPLPDWACWAIGHAVINTYCLICGQRERLYKRLWREDHLEGPRKRKALLARHEHPHMVYRPILWHEPGGNTAAYMEWRRNQ
jgi:hypothetical protein